MLGPSPRLSHMMNERIGGRPDTRAREMRKRCTCDQLCVPRRGALLASRRVDFNAFTRPHARRGVTRGVRARRTLTHARGSRASVGRAACVASSRADKGGWRGLDFTFPPGERDRPPTAQVEVLEGARAMSNADAPAPRAGKRVGKKKRSDDAPLKGRNAPRCVSRARMFDNVIRIFPRQRADVSANPSPSLPRSGSFEGQTLKIELPSWTSMPSASSRASLRFLVCILRPLPALPPSASSSP